MQDLTGCGHHCRAFIFPVTIVDHVPLNLDFCFLPPFFFSFFLTDDLRVSSALPRLQTLDEMSYWIFSPVGRTNTAETNICVVRVERRDPAEAHVHRLVHSPAHDWCRCPVGDLLAGNGATAHTVPFEESLFSSRWIRALRLRYTKC